MDIKPDKKKAKQKRQQKGAGGGVGVVARNTPSPSGSGSGGSERGVYSDAEWCIDALRRYAVAGAAAGLVDIGANIAKLMGKDLARVLTRSAAAGVPRVIITGTSARVSVAAQKTTHGGTGRYGVELYFTAGVHPHDARSWEDTATTDTLRTLLKDPRCVAAGEMGLDYDRLYSPKDVQMQVFSRQLALAAETSLPLFLHERDRGADKGEPLGSHADLVRMIDAAGIPPGRVCVHCFTASEADLRDYIARGYFIGVTGFAAMHKRGAALRAAIAAGALPLSRLMIETDAPYMKPDAVPVDIGVVGRNNEPCTLPSTARTLAECYKMDAAAFSAAVTENTVRFFNLDAVAASSAGA